MTVIAIWHEDSPTTESFDMQMWASTAQKIGPGTTLEAEESTYKNEIDRNMKIHEGMYFPCNVLPLLFVHLKIASTFWSQHQNWTEKNKNKVVWEIFWFQ